MKTITVFLASSNELNHDRNSFHALIASLDDLFEPRGIRIKCRRWEDFYAYCTGSRTQDDYNKIVRSCDLCICMFHKLAGKFTVEEFEQALNEYKENQDHPKTYVYIRTLAEGEIESDELKSFKDQLFKSIGHYWCNYANDDTMKLHFVMQFERLLPTMGLSASEGSQLKVENGYILLQGMKVAGYSNLSFAAANPEYQNLKEKYVQLDKDITQLRALGIDNTHDLLRGKIKNREKCREQIAEMEKSLLDMALLVNKSICSNSLMSERKRLAIEMFEQGNIKGVINVLNEEDMASEAKLAERDIARGRQQVENGNDLIKKGIQTIKTQVEEYLLRAKALMLDLDNAERFSLACNAYEQAVELSRNNLSKVELADLLFDYSNFLLDNNQFPRGKAIIEECVSIRLELYHTDPQAYEPDLADSYINLAILYSRTRQFSESEELFKSALSIRKRLAKENPLLYEPGLADSYNNVAILYWKTQRLRESEEMYKSALSICERLTKKNPQAYEPKLANSYNCLAILYSKTQRLKESEDMYKSALAIRKRLAKENPLLYEPDLAGSYNNLANLYSDTQRLREGEEMYKSALSVYERLTKKNSQAYEPDLAGLYYNLAILYSDTQRLRESEEMYKSALSIRERLAKENPQAYEPSLASSYNGMAILDSDTQRLRESEDMFKSALAIRERLAKENSQAYEPDLAVSYNNLAILYSNTQRFRESEEMYKSALAIRERLAKENPLAYEPFLANTYKQLAELYLSSHRHEESEEMFKSELEIRERLAKGN